MYSAIVAGARGAVPLGIAPIHTHTETGVEGVGPSGGDPHCREHRRSEVTHLAGSGLQFGFGVPVRVRGAGSGSGSGSGSSSGSGSGSGSS